MLCFSGGKDSIVMKHLANITGVKYDAHFHRTTADPPEVIEFIRQYHPDVTIDKPFASMFKIIIEHGCPPTRLMRYCCRELKEEHGKGRVLLDGIRQKESNARKARDVVDACPAQAKKFVHPIFYWTLEEVWHYIRMNNLPYPNLYDEGFKRLGCIGCPMGGWRTQIKEFKRWPKFYHAYMRCFEKLIELKPNRTWKTAQEVMDWWLEGHKVDL